MMEACGEQRAVALISGGMDSAVAAAMAKDKGFSLFALSFDYGQRHRIELAAAARVAAWLQVRDHKIVRVGLEQIGGSALTADIAVPKGQQSADIPITYVPARNLVFLSIAAGYAETVGADAVIIGANAIDYSGYPDCRPEFLAAFAEAARLGTKAGVEGRPLVVWAPLISMTKAEIVQEGRGLGLDFGITTSCYDPSPDGRPCGQCDSCRLRAKGFAEAGETDPLTKNK